MDIAVIGGGLTGLTAAYELGKSGHRVTVFEKEKILGGLAVGFRMPHWQWFLEKSYHHFFTNDSLIISLAKELGLTKDILIKRPITATLCQKRTRAGRRAFWSTLTQGSSRNETTEDTMLLEGCAQNAMPTSARNINIFQLDSPTHLLTFPLLSPFDKLRTAALLVFCKLNPFWQPLEKITAKQLFETIGGSASWRTLWQPLLQGKFGNYSDQVPASWLWARIKKRTSSLGYFCGGFQTLVDRLATEIKKRGGNIFTNTTITSIKQDVRSKPCLPAGRKYEVRIMQKNYSYIVRRKSYFDCVLITTPSSVAMKLIKFPKLYEQKLKAIPHLWAQTLILETKNPILNKTYWLNVADPSFPFVAVVAHTNFMDKKHYGGNHITYIGNYLPDNHLFLTMTKQQLLKKFFPYLRKINQQCNNLSAEASAKVDVTIQQSHLFTSANAQPVHTLNYSQKAPGIKTPLEGIYLANLDSIYPWDRGTNYAVDLGKKAADLINGSFI
jgi:protoporphyrinogen oxidase